MNTVRAGSLAVDGELLACLEVCGDQDRATVLILHGAGESRKERYLPLMTGLAEAGLASVAFDFSGHGESTGALGELSLERRHRQARGVLADLLRRRGGSPVIVMGFSMSGQTVCDLLAGDGDADRGVPSAAVLCCPAVYSRDAYGIPFGDPAFTRVLRRKGSWSDSPAFEALLGYHRPLLVVRPQVDEVIPEEISARIVGSRPPGLTREYVVEGASHQLMRRFTDRPGELRHVVALVAALLRW